ncbi:PREDICTED: uncharacterized protein LOC106298174 [Brassica oleracea var. oleracea]|uniref:uncharacterized protein LOC106298174 n=1 Tax=Brassica oleracea var. oleracea TaxID=109376 RepID=UPI0006A6DDDC|nr:PREDICTED: uncharacterized protein LOC106298174 [Brassica oleracea var. oleracea]
MIIIPEIRLDITRKYGDSGPRQLGIPLTAYVSEACSMNGWNLRPARSPEAENLHIALCFIPIPSQSSTPDSYSWQIDGVDLTSFSTKRTWDHIRPRGELQVWADVVWYKGFVPSHAFLMWVAHLDRLPTRSRIASWGLQIQPNCCICNHYMEDREHLFLRCRFSEEIWITVTKRLGYRPVLFHTWTAFVEWLGLRDSTCPSTLRKLVSQVTIYKIWIERNNRIHNDISSTPQVIFKKIDRQVKDAILVKKQRKNFRNLMQQWLKYE